MTIIISPPALGLPECFYVQQTMTSYDTASNIVSTIHNKPRTLNRNQRRELTGSLRSLINSMEDNLWKALERDYPQFRFRRQNQTIVVNYNVTGESIYINPGEVYKIKAWGSNDYYEALDTINRLQRNLWSNEVLLTRRWMDDWRRLGNQLSIINRRNCTTRFEPLPWPPTVVLPPPCLPEPPNPPGPIIPIYPCPPMGGQPIWNNWERRNWSVAGWLQTGQVGIPERNNMPYIVKIDGRELVYALPTTLGWPIFNVSKILWLFHDSSESSIRSARSWFTEYEGVRYVKKFLDAGYVVAAYDSYNRVSSRFNPTASVTTNRDIFGLTAAQNFMASRKLLPTTQHGTGMGHGGNFLTYAAKTMGISRVALHCIGGLPNIMQYSTYSADTLWHNHVNDNAADINIANANYNYLLANRTDLKVKYYTQQATEIKSSIFDAIPNVSGTVADAIITGLTAGAFIDVDGLPTSKYSSATSTERVRYLNNDISVIISNAFLSDTETYVKCRNDILQQIKISLSDNEFAGWLRRMVTNDPVETEVDLLFFTNPSASAF